MGTSSHVRSRSEQLIYVNGKQVMKLGIVITTYNRPVYLRECLEYLQRSYIPPGSLLVIVDDHSTDKTTLDLIQNFTYPGIEIVNDYSPVNRHVSNSLKRGHNLC